MKKVIIADDERPARELIREYLSHFPEMIILAECNNGVDALNMITELRPDLVLMDIQMPGMTGFEVLQKLDEIPPIIFSTAFDQYALEAFEVNAIDYLLKPYTLERFKKAIHRISTLENPILNQLQKLQEHLHPSKPGSYSSKIFVQKGNKLKAINQNDIIWLQAEKDYTWLITEDKRYLSNYGLGQLEEKLPDEQFVRVHRSSIVNLEFIQEIEKHPSGFDILMTNGDLVRVSRSYMEEIKKRLL